MLIKNARVLDPENKIDGIRDIRISEGMITELGTGLHMTPDEDKVLDASGLTAAPGFVDVHAHFRDPGQTEKENLHTGALSAAAGGYTSVVCMANTIPAVDSPEVIDDILNRAGKESIHIYQTAAVTIGRNGKELVDMALLREHGAAGFTDDGSPITDISLVKSAMNMAAKQDTVISFHEEDPCYVWEAGINNGRISGLMGLRGADRKAEYEMVERDLRMALETGAKVDIQHVSAKETVNIIRDFKTKDPAGLIHAEGTPHHFSLTEEAISEHGSMAKVNPPLRTEEDRQAVIKGLSDGTLDIIATDHAPHTAEEKSKELIQAPSGMIGLETSLALGITNLVDKGYISLMRLIELMSTNPAKLYGLKAGRLDVGYPADIVIFDPEAVWTVDPAEFFSRSRNTPFIGSTLKGRTVYTILGGNIVYHRR